MRDARRWPLSSLASLLACSGTALAVLAGATACGGSLRTLPGDEDADAAPEGGRRPPVPDGGEAGVPPICPDAPPPPVVEECNVFDPKSCPDEQVCYPITYPPREPCDTERYGTVCIQGGTAGQGEPCGSGNGCKGGFVCVITGGGTQCAKLCQLGKSSQCLTGYVCEPIDIPGYAACL